MSVVVPPADEEERQRGERRAIPITSEDKRCMEEAFEARMDGMGVGVDSPSLEMLRDECVDFARARLEDELQGEERGEGRAAHAKPEVHAPSLDEWRQHGLTHVPYHSWCPDCVAGKAVETHTVGATRPTRHMRRSSIWMMPS